jgi:hypothetical protein
VVVLPNGKTATPDLNTMGLFPVGIKETQPAPDWIFVDKEKAETSSLTIIGEGSSINNELRLRFSLEAPKAYKNVFAVVYISSAHASGCLVQEVGDMVAFRKETVTFGIRLNQELGDNHYFVYVFADGKELRQPLRYPEAFEARIAEETLARKSGSVSPLPIPYLTFPPRGIRKSGGKVLADVTVDQFGRVRSVAVKEGATKAEAAKIVEAVNYWWFVPAGGAKEGQDFRISIDLSALNRWSETAVQVLPVAGPG